MKTEWNGNELDASWIQKALIEKVKTLPTSKPYPKVDPMQMELDLNHPTRTDHSNATKIHP